MKKILSTFLLFTMLGGIKASAYARDIESMGKFKAIFPGTPTAAINMNDELFIWGYHKRYYDFWYQYNDCQTTPKKIMDDVKSAASGDRFLFILKNNGELWAIAEDKTSELERKKPVKLMEDVVSLADGENPTMVINKKGELWQIKMNFGDIFFSLNRVVTEKFMDDAASAFIGRGQKFAVKTNGELWAWGENGEGQLGDGTTESRSTPVKIMDDVRSVMGGANYSMAIKTNGELWGWGYNHSGQLGDGSFEARLSPVKIMEDVESVSIKWHSAAIKTNGELWTWGSNGDYEIGDGTNEHRGIPIKIMEDVLSVSVSATNTFAIKTNGELWGWGYNRGGMVGIDFPENAVKQPAKISDNAKLVQASSSVYMIDNNDELWAWGYNADGQVGNGNTEWQPLPVKISVFPSNWAIEEVAKAYENKLFPEDMYVNFKDNISRADFCRLAVNLVELRKGKRINDILESKGIYDVSVFTDTDDRYVLAANELLIVNGVGKNMFKPENPITREEAAIMLTRTAKHLGFMSPNEESTVFGDSKGFAGWSADYIDFISGCADKTNKKRVMEGMEDNMFRPKGYYTREQAFITFNRLLAVLN